MLGRPNQFFSIRNRPEAGLRKPTGPRDLEQHLRQEDMEWQVRTKSEQLFHELPTLFLHPKIRIDHASGPHTTESKRLDWTSISRKDLIPVLRIEANTPWQPSVPLYALIAGTELSTGGAQLVRGSF